MFKKPLGNLKTSAPLRASDRRKLKQRVVAAFGVTPEEGDLLVPDGILSIKFNTHLREPGVAYLAPDGNPLWFTIGKGSEDLVPTIYTLWKKQDILPTLSTPPAVIPVLVGGADLMIPGVIHFAPGLVQGQLVSVCQYARQEETLSPPLVVGRMALSGEKLSGEGGDGKGKAVLVLHAWKDHLWKMGTKGDVPPATPVQTRQVPGEGDGDGEDVGAVKEGEQGQGIQADMHEGSGKDGEASEGMDVSLESGDIPQENGEGETTTVPSLTYTPQEITTLLHKSLLQAISTTLVSLPVSSFPIPSTQFYQNHILPCRPGYPGLVLRPACATDDTTEEEIIMALNPQDISIKTSTHKSLSTFLKAAEKASLVTLKTPQKHSQQTDVLVMSVNGKNAEVTGHVSFVTLREIEEKAAKRASREAGEGVMEELKIRQLWKPHLDSVPVFEGFGVNTKAQYTLEEVKKQLNSYISSQNLVNPQDQAYINLDPLLMACVTAKDRTRTKNKDQEDQELPLGEFIKREDLVKRVIKRMQEWYEIQVPGRDVIRKKGSLKPIKVQAKMRQGGRKASTNVVGFEPFLVVDAEAMAEELRRVCAGSTSVSPVVPGKPELEVMVQGKQVKDVVDYLIGRGVPKKWIEVVDGVKGKKGASK